MRCNFENKDFIKVNKIPAPLQVLVSEERSTSKGRVPCAFLFGMLGISLPTCRQPKGFWTVCSGFFFFHTRAQGSRIGRVCPITRVTYYGGCKGKLLTQQVNRENDFLPSGDCRTRKNSHQARAAVDEVPKKEQIPQHTAKPRQRGKRCRLWTKKKKSLVEEALSIHPQKTHWRERATLLLLEGWGRGQAIQENHRGRKLYSLSEKG